MGCTGLDFIGPQRSFLEEPLSNCEGPKFTTWIGLTNVGEKKHSSVTNLRSTYANPFCKFLIFHHLSRVLTDRSSCLLIRDRVDDVQ